MDLFFKKRLMCQACSSSHMQRIHRRRPTLGCSLSGDGRTREHKMLGRGTIILTLVALFLSTGGAAETDEKDVLVLDVSNFDTELAKHEKMLVEFYGAYCPVDSRMQTSTQKQPAGWEAEFDMSDIQTKNSNVLQIFNPSTGNPYIPTPPLSTNEKCQLLLCFTDLFSSECHARNYRWARDPGCHIDITSLHIITSTR